MSSATELSLYPILGASAVAAATDLARGKIYNWLTFPVLLGGISAGAALGGWSGLGQALLGAGLAFAAFAWMFYIGFLGGGDVKLLMALGAWGGPAYAAKVALGSILIGGAVAFVLLLFRGTLPGLMRRIWRFALTIAVRELEVEMPRVDRTHTMPFGISIAVAAAWVALGGPFT